jgi:hypothetical protein
MASLRIIIINNKRFLNLHPFPLIFHLCHVLILLVIILTRELLVQPPVPIAIGTGQALQGWLDLTYCFTLNPAFHTGLRRACAPWRSGQVIQGLTTSWLCFSLLLHPSSLLPHPFLTSPPKNTPCQISLNI